MEGIIKDHEEELIDLPDWELDDLRPSVSYKVRLSMQSAFDEVKMAWAEDRIYVPTDVRRDVLLMREGVQSIVWRVMTFCDVLLYWSPHWKPRMPSAERLSV